MHGIDQKGDVGHPLLRDSQLHGAGRSGAGTWDRAAADNAARAAKTTATPTFGQTLRLPLGRSSRSPGQGAGGSTRRSSEPNAREHVLKGLSLGLHLHGIHVSAGAEPDQKCLVLHLHHGDPKAEIRLQAEAVAHRSIGG